MSRFVEEVRAHLQQIETLDAHPGTTAAQYEAVLFRLEMLMYRAAFVYEVHQKPSSDIDWNALAEELKFSRRRVALNPCNTVATLQARLLPVVSELAKVQHRKPAVGSRLHSGGLSTDSMVPN